MTVGSLGIALSGLNAAQAGISTTEHNIANVNTAGYRRQEVNYTALQPQFTGAGYFGNGVGVETVRSLYSQFLDNQALQNQTLQSKYEAYSPLASQVDKMLGDSSSGLSTSMDSFFSAVNDVANDPTSDAARQVMLSAGKNLSGRITTLSTKLGDYISSTNNEITTITGQASLYASQIAKLNNDIARAEASSSGNPANDLRDQRQELISQLNNLVNVSVVQQSDGSTNVFIGNGQPLVVGSRANTLSSAVDVNNSALRVPTLVVGGTTMTLGSGSISAGQLGGVMALREDVLLPAQRDLDRLAFAFADQFNTQHASGFDKAGVAGGAFFTTSAAMLQQPAALQGTVGVATAALSNSSQLVASDYRLTFDGANYTLLRLSDGASSTGAIGAVTTLNGQAQGFTLAVAGAVAGDSWMVRPTAGAANAFALNAAMSDPSLIAASATAAGSPGDNSNALALASLQINGGFTNNVSFTGAYNTLITRTASLASESDLNLATFTSLATDAGSAARSVSGVNLDEEAANLIRFQQAYQASAKAMQIASALFTDLLGILQ